MKLLKTLPIGLAFSLWASAALAGSLQLQDEVHLLSSSDVSTLKTTASRWPFDTHILIANAEAKAILEARAHALVDGPNVVVIAMDPKHHTTVVRVATGTRVKTMDFDSIASAGNPAFRESRWVTGLEAIGARAELSTRTTVGTVAPQPPIVVREGLSFWAWGAIIFGVLLLVWLVVKLYRKSQRNNELFQSALDENREETAALRSDNIRYDRWADPGYTAPAPRQTSRVRTPTAVYVPGHVSAPAPIVTTPSTVVVNQSSGSDLMTGMAIGHMMSDSHHHHHDREVVHERVIERSPTYTSSPSYDGGGSSSSYDSGGSSSNWGSSSSSAPDSNRYGSSSSSSYSSSSSSSSWSDSSSSSSYDSGSSSSYDSGGSSSSFDSGGSSSDW